MMGRPPHLSLDLQLVRGHSGHLLFFPSAPHSLFAPPVTFGLVEC